MRHALSTKEIERSLVMAKGWLEFGFYFDHKIGVGQWGADGKRDLFEDASWTYQTEGVKIRYGISPRAELWWEFRVHQAHLENSLLGTDISDASIGDPRFGYNYLLYSDEDTSVALEATVKSPLGKESPGTYIGGPLNVSGFIFTTGTAAWTLGVAGKRMFGPLAVTGRLAYRYSFSNIVQYLVELERSQFSGRIKPGDVLLAEVDVMFQAGPVVLSVTPQFESRAKTKLGTTSPGLHPNKYLDPVHRSNGQALNLRLQTLFGLSRGVDVAAYTLLPVMGEDLQFFPIEEIHPTLGPTFGGALEVRY